jgi:hypothetical protein
MNPIQEDQNSNQNPLRPRLDGSLSRRRKSGLGFMTDNAESKNEEGARLGIIRPVVQSELQIFFDKTLSLT